MATRRHVNWPGVDNDGCLRREGGGDPSLTLGNQLCKSAAANIMDLGAEGGEGGPRLTLGNQLRVNLWACECEPWLPKLRGRVGGSQRVK